MEDKFKEIVLLALDAKLGRPVSVTHTEWNTAVTEALKDIYINKICQFNNIRQDDFINVLVGILYIQRRETILKEVV